MFRCLYLLLALLLLGTASAQAGHGDDGPPISITSPDASTTYAYASIKNRQLIWNKKEGMLVACITFTDEQRVSGAPSSEMLRFRLPGITFDEAKGIFSATSAKGVVIPVARIKKTLFIKGIEVLPNANVRVMYPRGNVMVVLEAISPDDPAMQPKPSNPDGEQKIPLDKVLY